MGEPLSLDRVFDFPMDEPEPHPAYDFFAPGPLPSYAGKPNNTNEWIKADVPLLGEMGEPLGAEADELMVGPVVDEIVEPIVEMEEQMVALVIDVEEDIAKLFDDDDFSDDDSEGFEDDEEVGGPSTAAAEGKSFTLQAPRFPVSSLVSDAEVANGIAIREIGPRNFAVEG
ncbi:hypothetical protein Tco_0085452 [Tanacetum coccineum]